MKKLILLLCIFFVCPFCSYAYTENVGTINQNNYSDIIITDNDLSTIENDLVWSKLNRNINIDNNFVNILILLFIIILFILILSIILGVKYIKRESYN